MVEDVSVACPTCNCESNNAEIMKPWCKCIYFKLKCFNCTVEKACTCINSVIFNQVYWSEIHACSDFFWPADATLGSEDNNQFIFSIVVLNKKYSRDF